MFSIDDHRSGMLYSIFLPAFSMRSKEMRGSRSITREEPTRYVPVTAVVLGKILVSAGKPRDIHEANKNNLVETRDSGTFLAQLS